MLFKRGKLRMNPHRPFEQALLEIRTAEMNKNILRLKSPGGKPSLGHVLSKSLQDYILKTEPKKSNSDLEWLENFIKNCVPLTIRETASPCDHSWTPVTLLNLHNVPERSFISFMVRVCLSTSIFIVS
ncbi:unnamed protein product [Allacma fusca]|uniref:Uncharacterized protein n=1 Tax=Allacma fusca TaxID=39272 RepID=A0A8J2PCV8_9HEXA|nr:unnamed protein product [Allacma fusca]